MKRYFLVLFFSFIALPAFSQSWVQDVYARYSDGQQRINELRNVTNQYIGTEAPSISFRNIDEDNISSIEDYRGTPLLIVFMRSTCRFCVDQLPILEQLEQTYDSSKLQVLHLSQQDERTLKAFRQQFNIHSDIGIGVDVANFPRPFQIAVTPTVFMLDADGIIQDAWIGMVPYDILSASVANIQ